ncbi:hypothetical protein [Oscillatoria sp. HE19RPO]|uniref:hypothetical protein n=1 Tax=Oscillatoria sp. HE19RPO TaxID=2954806 RepID=UPI0020C334BE|nr:hypothetical protein [Oscillatoria sp. HE19RPO]
MSHYTDPKKIIKALTLNAKDGFNLAALAQAIAIKEDDFDPEDWTQILQEWQTDEWASCPSLQLYAEIVARRNFAWKHHAELLKAELAAEGFQVVEVMGEDSYASELVKAAKLEIKQKVASQRFQGWSGPLTLEDARIILDDPAASEADRNEAKGVLLREDLPGFAITPEWIFANIIQNPLYISRLRLGYWLEHPELAKILDGMKLRSHFKQWRSSIIFAPDLTTVGAKLQLLQAIGIEEIINSSGFATTLDDPLIAEFWEKCWFRRYQMSRILGVPISANSKPGKILASILQKVGLKLKCFQRGKDRQRIYQVEAPADRDDIFQAWDLKYADLVAAGEQAGSRIPEITRALSVAVQPVQTDETQSGQASVGVNTSPHKNAALINTPTCVHPDSMEKSDPIPVPEAPLTGSLECNYPAGDRSNPESNDFAANRTDIEGWAELLKLVAHEPDADAQLLADATVGLPSAWRHTIWQRLSGEVRERLQQIRSLVQPLGDWMTST